MVFSRYDKKGLYLIGVALPLCFEIIPYSYMEKYRLFW